MGTSAFGYGAWSLGFLTEHNFVLGAQQQKVKSLPDVFTVLRYMDDYCKENPSKKFVSGLIKFYFDLPTEDFVRTETEQ